MLGYLRHYFNPDREELDFSLSISFGREGARSALRRHAHLDRSACAVLGQERKVGKSIVSTRPPLPFFVGTWALSRSRPPFFFPDDTPGFQLLHDDVGCAVPACDGLPIAHVCSRTSFHSPCLHLLPLPSNSSPSPASHGTSLSHNHSLQYHYVEQSLFLWHEVTGDMFRLWCLAEADLLDPRNPYRLRDTGQGLNRMQVLPPPSLSPPYHCLECVPIVVRGARERDGVGAHARVTLREWP